MIVLTKAEHRALRVVGAEQAGLAGTVAQVLSPAEYPGDDINAVRILKRLETANLIAPLSESGDRFEATAAGRAHLQADVSWTHVSQKG